MGKKTCKEVKLNSEDFFTFGNAEASFAQVCDICKDEIPPKTLYKSNAGWRRIHHVKMCMKCFQNVDLYINLKMKEIGQKIQEQEDLLTDSVVQVCVQNCDEMTRLEILKKLRRLQEGLSFQFKIHESICFGKYTRNEINSISFSVKNSEDFKRKFSLINKARTNCGCGLFVGDGCHSEAYILKNGERFDVEFNLFGDVHGRN